MDNEFHFFPFSSFLLFLEKPSFVGVPLAGDVMCAVLQVGKAAINRYRFFFSVVRRTVGGVLLSLYPLELWSRSLGSAAFHGSARKGGVDAQLALQHH